MRIAIVTNIRSPYRKLQIEDFQKNTHHDITVAYIDNNIIGRKWNVEKIENVDEKKLSYIKKQHDNINTFQLLKNNDIIFIGGYERIKYMLLSLLCKVLKKPYVLIYDGIDPTKISKKDSFYKYVIKKFVISNASIILGNGIVSKKLFTEKFSYDKDKIINQYLSIDNEKIFSLGNSSENFRNEIRNKYNISAENIVLIYSGRLISRKNVEHILYSMKSIGHSKFTLLVMGDGEEKEKLMNLAKKLAVDIIITGFISDQEKLFEHYFAGDIFILPSSDEPWGLVVNEAMAAGLPVIVTEKCGSSLDLVKDNGYVYKEGDINALTNILKDIDENNLYTQLGKASKEIIKNWSFTQSTRSYGKVIETINKRD